LNKINQEVKMKNNRQLEKRVSQDTDRIKKDLNALLGDSTALISRFENDLVQSTGRVKDGIAQMSGKVEKLSNDAKESVIDATAVMKREMGRGLSSYNARAQEVANKVPGDLGRQAIRYPWVTITVALVIGFLLGGLVKPARIRVIERQN
jgi:ElaB/YqjD/DUF883 family membrane-anchored ribosome-binding protein